MGNLQILLRQHVGAPCAAVVKAGDRVEKGTLIATPTGLGANIFSSAYGVVEEVKEDRIIIRPDEVQKDEFVPIQEGSKLDMVKSAGVVGMGGAGFPTGVKLGTDLKGGYILVNAAECEPGLRHNIQQLEEDCEKVIRGVKHCMEISNAAKAIFAIKKKNEKAVARLREALKDEDAITIHLLPDIYPMGEERAVVRAPAQEMEPGAAAERRAVQIPFDPGPQIQGQQMFQGMHPSGGDFLLVGLAQPDVEVGNDVPVFPGFLPDQPHIRGLHFRMIQGEAFDDDFFHIHSSNERSVARFVQHFPVS